MMMQLPAATPVTVVPFTVQMEGVEELKVTVPPGAVAEIVEVPPTSSVLGVNVMALMVWARPNCAVTVQAPLIVPVV